MKLSVVAWRWGGLFGPEYVRRLRRGLRKHLHLDHELVLVTDDPNGIDDDVRIVPMPERWKNTPRCRRRMQQYDRVFARAIGKRILSIDLDVVITTDITPLVDRPEPIVCWKVGYAKVFSGSFVLYDFDALHGAYEAYANDPVGFPTRAWPKGVGSDQAMLNFWLKSQPPVAFWTEKDGIITYFGEGYERQAHLGVGPSQPQLPPDTRLVVLGSSDKLAMDEGRFDWIREHWIGLDIEAAA